jgi:hypothetical protein
MGSSRRSSVGRGVLLLAVGALLALGTGCAQWPGQPPRPADRPVVTNPGRFTATAGPGSFLELVDSEGTPIAASHVAFGRPACADGKDNDLDGAPDAGSDRQCVGAEDANERLDGLQPAVASTLPLDVGRNGTIVVDPTRLVVQQREYCFDAGELWCTAITLRGAGPRRLGRITGSSLTVPIPITIELDALTGFPDFGSDCEIPYIDSVFSGRNYDESAGTVRLATSDVPVAAAADCGPWTEEVNSVLGLPTVGDSVIELTIANRNGDPIQLR